MALILRNPIMLPPAEDFEITPIALHALRENSDTPDLLLIDCREEDEFALCRIEGGELYPLSRFAELSPDILSPEDTRPMIIYCHHGMRSMQATLFLRGKGRNEVWSLSGGIDQWSTEIDPTVPRY